MSQEQQLAELKKELCAEPIISEDGIMKFQFNEKGTVEITQKGFNPKRVKYAINSKRSEDGMWLLEYSFNGIDDAIPFFYFTELRDELTDRDWNAKSY